MRTVAASGSDRGVHATSISINGIAPSRALILIIEARPLLRECLTKSLRKIAAPDHVISFHSVTEWRKAPAADSTPDAVVLSVSKLEHARDVIEQYLSGFSTDGASPPPVVVLADHGDPTAILESLDAGARGFIPTDVSIEVALEIIRVVIAGGSYVPASALVASQAESGQLRSAHSKPFGIFTERQLAIVEMLRVGKANKSIAEELNMRESTVKVHIRNIMRKLQASNRTQVAYLYQAMMSRPAPDAVRRDANKRQDGS